MNRLKKLRKEAGLKQIQIQIKFNIDQSEYSKIERAIREPTMQQAIEFAKFYNTSIDYIMKQTNVRKPYPRA